MAAARLGLKTHVYCADSGPAFDVATRTTKAAFDDPAALSAFAGNGRRGHLRVRERGRRHRPPPRRPGAGAAERQGPGGGAGPADREELHRRARHPRRTLPRRRRPGGADRRARLPRRAGHPEDAPAGLRRQGPGARRARRGRRRRLGSGRRACRRCWRSASPFALELSALVVRGAGRRKSPSTTARATRTRTASCAAPSCRRACRQPTSPAPATSPGPSPARSTTSACWRSRCSTSVPTRRAAERLMVNEIAPRVHNSGHWTIEACAISQFENHIRAVAGWPLGSTARHSDAEMVNLIGAGGARLAAARRGARRLASTSTASARRAPGARWATSPGCCLLAPAHKLVNGCRYAEIPLDPEANTGCPPEEFASTRRPSSCVRTLSCLPRWR